MNGRVVLTGANGFVGLNILFKLLENNYEVTALVRKGSNLAYVPQDRVRIVYWPNRSQELLPIVSGHDYLIHCAGNTSTSPKHREELERSNVDTTKALLECAEKAGIQRFVYTSSSSTIGGSNHGHYDETCPLTGFRALSVYAKSKLRAERLLLSQNRVPAVILNPTEVVGAYDHNLQWGRIILAIATRRLTFVPPGGASFCHAESVAEAHVAALTKGKTGERYLLAGHDMTFFNFFRQIAEQLKVSLENSTRVPYWLLRSWAYFREYWLGLEEQSLDAFRMCVFSHEFYFSDAKAQRELGYRSKTANAMISDCHLWYRKHNFL